MSALPTDASALDTLSPDWELKELKPLHKQVAALHAQGLRNTEVAQLCNITPEYVYVLLKQPKVREYLAEMCSVAGTRLEALFVKTVDVISETLENGSETGKLKAARLQLEATKRIGSREGAMPSTGDSVDRIAKLAERLIALQSNIRTPRTFDNETGSEIQEALVYGAERPDSPSEVDG